ncbi:MAG: hypothetical protein PT118_23455 [Aphanizomenon gracile PMC644.10]|nr:hypothetical protein [Aphanizomenon gracile PMC644.10]
MYGNLFFKISLPNQRSPFPKLLKSELLAAALRYRPLTPLTSYSYGALCYHPIKIG